MRKFSSRIIKQIVIVAIFVVMAGSVGLIIATNRWSTSEQTEHVSKIDHSRGNITMIQQTCSIIDGYNTTLALPMASTTKILTALVACESGKLDNIVTVPKEATLVEGSSIYLKEGERIKLLDLVYGLMLRSGNDSAVCIAKYLGGSVENFAKMMNDKAKALGANSSNFVNPHGLHDDNHYTTAYDLGLITCKALNNENFKKIVNTKVHKIKSENNPDRVIANKNKMLSMYDGCIGVKTGFTKKAGRCLVSASERGGVTLVCVVLNHGDMWNDSISMLNKGYQMTQKVQLVQSNKSLISIPLPKSNAVVGGYIKNDINLVRLKKSNSKLEYQMKFEEKINLPLKKDTIIGKIEIYNDNHLLFSENIYNIIDIDGKGEYPLSKLAENGYGLEWLKLLD